MHCARNTVGREVLAEHGIELVAEGACSGCANAVTSLLTARQKAGGLDALRDTVLMFGPCAERLPEKRTAGKRVVRVGSCTRGLAGYGHYVPGCPPFLYGRPEELAEAEA